MIERRGWPFSICGIPIKWVHRLEQDEPVYSLDWYFYREEKAMSIDQTTKEIMQVFLGAATAEYTHLENINCSRQLVRLVLQPLYDELEKLRSNNDEFIATITRKNQELDRAYNASHKADKNANELLAAGQVMTKTIGDKQAEINKLEQDLHSVQQKNRELREACERLNGEIAKVESLSKTAYEAPTAEHHRKLLDVEKRVVAADKQYREMYEQKLKELEVSREANDRFHEDEVKALRSRNTLLLKEKARAMEELDKLGQTLLAANGHLERFDRDCQHKQATIETLCCHMTSSEAGRKDLYETLCTALQFLKRTSEVAGSLLGLKLEAKNLIMQLRVWLAAIEEKMKSFAKTSQEVNLKNFVATVPADRFAGHPAAPSGNVPLIQPFLDEAAEPKAASVGFGPVAKHLDIDPLGQSVDQSTAMQLKNSGAPVEKKPGLATWVRSIVDSDGKTGNLHEIPVADGKGGWQWMSLAAMVTGGFGQIRKDVESAQPRGMAQVRTERPEG